MIVFLTLRVVLYAFSDFAQACSSLINYKTKEIKQKSINIFLTIANKKEKPYKFQSYLSLTPLSLRGA